MDQNSHKKLTVSVFVPSYNHSRFVRRSLESIFNQTHKPLELIVIDDGSTDGSPKIIEQILKDCPFDCDLIVRPNKGAAATTNEGVERTKGDFFAPLPSDDIWLPDFLKRRVELLKQRPNAVLAYGNCYVMNVDDKITGCTVDWGNFQDGNARNMLLSPCTPSGPTTVFRRSALLKNEWNPELLIEDYDLYLRLCQIGDFAFDPDVLSAWRNHSYNTSKNISLMVKGTIEALQINASGLNLTDKEIEEIEAKIKWDSLEGYLLTGQRLEAIKVALQSSNVEVPRLTRLREYMKLLLPYSFLQAGRKFIKRESSVWHGIDVKDLISEQVKGV